MAATEEVALQDTVDDNESTNQYVTFQVADEVFGFSMSAVLEIIRLPDTVRVPLTPTALVGLANLRGSVLPVLDLRQILQFEPGENNNATRVIITDVGNPVGLVVDRVAQVVDVDPELIDAGDKIQSSINTDLIVGVIKSEGGGPLIQLLNPKQLIIQQFDSVSAATTRLVGANGQQVHVADQEIENEDTKQLVSFTVDNQEYAFDLMEVEEIVRVPDEVSKVPQTDSHVLGLIDLRGRLLPLVSLRQMFALPETPLSETNRILVISVHRLGGGKHSIGLVVDDIKEVITISKELQEDVPALLADGDDDTIAGICRLENGRRLVSVLHSESLFAHPDVQEALGTSENKESADVETENHQQNFEQDEDVTQLVIFKLGAQEYGVSIDDVQEITRIPDKLDKVPKTASFIEGMANLRGTVLPVLDMRSRFEMEKLPTSEQQRIVVLNLAGTKTGFIVDSVTEVLRLQHNQIENAPSLSEDQARIMGHVVNLKEQKRMIQVLTAKELLSENEITAIDNNLSE